MLLSALLAIGSFATDASAATVPQTVSNWAKRVFAPANKKIDIDGVDDVRVDADVAVLDIGVDLDNPDLNVVKGVDCVGAEAKTEYQCTTGPGAGDDPSGSGHGTEVAERLAAIDNGIGREGGVAGVGVAPGARIWAVDVGNEEEIFPEEEGKTSYVRLAPLIAGVKWVTAHADQIEILHMSAACFTNAEAAGLLCKNDAGAVAGSKDAQVLELEAAVLEAIKEGLVVTTPAGNSHEEVTPEADGIIGRMPEVVTVSAVFDSDGLPGALGVTESCGADDSSSVVSHYGPGVDIGAPGCATSAATPHVSGAAAILASRDNPGNAKDVEDIRDTLVEEGNTKSAAEGGWDDESGDGIKEPLVDVSDEVVFNPVMVKPPRFSFEFGSSGSGAGQFSYPASPSVDAAGNVWVPDTLNNRLEKFNSYGEYLTQFGTKGSGNGQLNSPIGTAIDSSGNIWVVDSANNRLEKFNSKGEYLTQFGTKGSGNGQLSNPFCIAIDSSGNIWVTDRGNNRVQKFDSTGKYLLQFGKVGLGNGEFTNPSGIAVDSSGNVWVVDSGNNRVQKFDSTGKYLLQFGSKGADVGQLDKPTDIDIDPEGNPWVTDGTNHRVQGFDSEGGYRIQIGTQGTGNGQFEGPAGIAADALGDLWITDGTNLKVQKWRVMSWATESVSNAGGANNNRLTGVSCTSATFCFATANLISIGTSWAYGRSWDGSTWTAQGGIPENSGTVLSAVSCVSSTSCTTVGYKTEAGGEVTLAEYWDGTKWARQTTPSPAGYNTRLTGVSCTSASFCFTVGNASKGGVSYAFGGVWNGSAWKGIAEIPSNAGAVLNGVSCTSSTSCTAVGYKTEASGEVVDLIEYWDGTKWTRQELLPTGPDKRLTAVSCTSSTFCFATGNLTSIGTSWAYGAVWNGSTWTGKGGIPDNAGTVLSGVSCTSSTVCTAVGSKTKAGGKVIDLVENWNGTKWIPGFTPPNAEADNRLAGVSCIVNCMAVGSYTKGSEVWNLAERSP